MYDIILQEDYMEIVAQLGHADAKNLLDFVLGFIFDATFDDTQQARLFLLKTMSNTHIEPPPNPNDPENYSFPLLLYILKYHSWVRDTSYPEITPSSLTNNGSASG